MLDSLVRVSRRVDENHFVSIAIGAVTHPAQSHHPTAQQNIVFQHIEHMRHQVITP